jgi:hypothetical protein
VVICGRCRVFVVWELAIGLTGVKNWVGGKAES